MSPPKQRTPLTLEYQPEGLENEHESIRNYIVIEPSFQHSGRIFIGIHPFGAEKRFGCHLLPADAERVRSHLAKLLMESTPDETVVEWQDRIERAAQRAKRPRRKRPRFKLPIRFRIEFQIGKIQGVIGTAADA